jgi:NAD(P)-dependent dehydrogenase (short-subunit alcohol dehydrogenase family)
VAALLPERPRADLAETIALRRFGNAVDVAALVAFLLSDDASDITGRVLEVPSAIVLLKVPSRARALAGHGASRARA